jgi:dTDP-4-amino-4,6-dideoxygalactose transaminase
VSPSGVPLLDLHAQNAPLREQLLASVARVLDGGSFILGPDVAAFESELAVAIGARHIVAVSSGTDALLATLMALGIGRGDEVVTTPFSFYATAGCIVRVGARPVFADIERTSFNLDPAAASAACGPRTRAVIPVNLFGRPANLPQVSVPVVEDAAQALGTPRSDGLARCYSFFPSKNLGGFGDAGAVATDDEALDDRLRLLRTHGGRPKYVHHAVGGNFRMDTLQAALLRVKLPHLADWSVRRRANAQRYRDLFATTPGIPDDLVLPEDVPGHSYNQFVIRAPARDALRVHLANNRIGTEVYYPIPFHFQPCFRDLGYQEGAFPLAEAACREALALPIFPELSEAQQGQVVKEIAAFYMQSGS